MPLRRPQLRHDFVEIREVEPRDRLRRNYHPPRGSQPAVCRFSRSKLRARHTLVSRARTSLATSKGTGASSCPSSIDEARQLLPSAPGPVAVEHARPLAC